MPSVFGGVPRSPPACNDRFRSTWRPMECRDLWLNPRPRQSKGSRSSAQTSQIRIIRVGKCAVGHDISRGTERTRRYSCRRRPTHAARLGRFCAASWDSSAWGSACRKSPPPPMIEKELEKNSHFHLPTSSCSVGCPSFAFVLPRFRDKQVSKKNK